MVERDWPYPVYEKTFLLEDSFLILEEFVKQKHGCIKNLAFYNDATLKNK